ncbi:MAG: hypothetical protein WAS07_01350 [Micropruina sp.]
MAMLVRSTWLATVLGVALLLSGCVADAKPATVATHTLQTAEYSYAGYLVPKVSRKLSVSATKLAVRPGDTVAAGEKLRESTAAIRERRRVLRSAVSAYTQRVRLASAALASLRNGGSGFYAPAGSASAADVRTAEREITAAKTAEARAALTYKNQLSKLTEAKATSDIAFHKADRTLAQREYRTRLIGLFDSLKTACTTAKSAAEGKLAGLDVKAPFAGVVTLTAGEVWINSAATSFVYVATEDQLDSVAAQTSLELRVKGTAVGTLKLASSSYDAEATTSAASPRYRLLFDVKASADFTPRDHGTASATFQGTNLAVPSAFLGHDSEGDFVLVGGERRAVTVEKDALGQLVLTSGGLTAGDVIQQVSS